MEKKRFHIYVSGIVQGVFFRANTFKKAKELGIFGWVRNLADGRVEILIEGQCSKIKEFIEWAKKGTPPARVEKIEIIEEEYKNEFDDFNILY